MGLRVRVAGEFGMSRGTRIIRQAFLYAKSMYCRVVVYGDTHARVAPPHPTSPRLASYVIVVSAGREWFARFRSLAQDVRCKPCSAVVE